MPGYDCYDQEKLLAKSNLAFIVLELFLSTKVCFQSFDSQYDMYANKKRKQLENTSDLN